jgi:hypothetical protein
MVKYEKRRSGHIAVKYPLGVPGRANVSFVTVGSIRQVSARFGYFEPELNDTNPLFVEDDIDSLKRRIEALHDKSRGGS